METLSIIEGKIDMVKLVQASFSLNKSLFSLLQLREFQYLEMKIRISHCSVTRMEDLSALPLTVTIREDLPPTIRTGYFEPP